VLYGHSNPQPTVPWPGIRGFGCFYDVRIPAASKKAAVRGFGNIFATGSDTVASKHRPDGTLHRPSSPAHRNPPPAPQPPRPRAHRHPPTRPPPPVHAPTGTPAHAPTATRPCAHRHPPTRPPPPAPTPAPTRPTDPSPTASNTPKRGKGQRPLPLRDGRQKGRPESVKSEGTPPPYQPG
jgi:hypothetical protein